MATTAQLGVRLIIGMALVLSGIACGGASSSVTGPTGVLTGSSTARITGRVNGVTAASTSRDTSSVRATTSLRVSIVGTNITTNVDGSGQFTLTGVPPGDVTLEFSGSGVSARLTLTGVTASQEIRIEVRLNGNSARLESERRDRRDDDDDDDDDDEDDELEGAVSGLTGACPSLTFTVAGRTVRTSSATVFEDSSCVHIRNNVRVEVKGMTAADGTFTATRVELED